MMGKKEVSVKIEDCAESGKEFKLKLQEIENQEQQIREDESDNGGQDTLDYDDGDGYRQSKYQIQPDSQGEEPDECESPSHRSHKRNSRMPVIKTERMYNTIMNWQDRSCKFDNQVATKNMMNVSDLLRHQEMIGPEFKQNMQNQNLYPPPLEVYKPKVSTNYEYVNFGLNMYFKKPHKFSLDPGQGGGDLAPNQPFLSQPWGACGCPGNKQQNLTDYVASQLKNTVFCRYGLEYLKTFPRLDDLAIGSYKINLDYLIFQKQRQMTESENKTSLVEMNFLKTKGKHQMNRAEIAAQVSSRNSQSPQNSQAAQPQTRMILPFYKQLDDTTVNNTLEFDSVFESGNLALAIKVTDNEYNLLLQNDINTNGHTQWFYFKVKSNFQKKTDVKFSILNLYKPKSLYQYGMRVLTLDVTKSIEKARVIESTNDTLKTESQAEEELKLPEWQRSCKDISYIQNKYTNEFSHNGLYQVSFTYEFSKGEQHIYFAHSIPYTYSMLQEYLSKQKVKRQTLCHSLAGNKVEYLYVTNTVKPPSQSLNEQQQKLEEQASKVKQIQQSKGNKRNLGQQKNNLQKQSNYQNTIKKQVIMLTSRVHPGETGASWMMHGLMETLLNPKTQEEKELVKNLKDHFEFYIIPMLNVDGVINGNYRCSLAACDLNRKWTKPSKALHPPVYYTKKLCDTLVDRENKKFFLYLDFHGHSVKKNIFQYGNKTENWTYSRQRSHCGFSPSLFPMVLSKQFDYFNFHDCTFSMPKHKESTARITMFQRLRIPFVFTLEASFAGASTGALKGKHFSVGDLMNVGKYVLQAFWQIKKLTLNKAMLKQISDEAQSQVKQSNIDDAQNSDDSASSEEEGEIPTSENVKAVMEAIQEEVSPDPVRRTPILDDYSVEIQSPISVPTRREERLFQPQKIDQSFQSNPSNIINLKQITPPRITSSIPTILRPPPQQIHATEPKREELSQEPLLEHQMFKTTPTPIDRAEQQPLDGTMRLETSATSEFPKNNLKPPQVEPPKRQYKQVSIIGCPSFGQDNYTYQNGYKIDINQQCDTIPSQSQPLQTGNSFQPMKPSNVHIQNKVVSYKNINQNLFVSNDLDMKGNQLKSNGALPMTVKPSFYNFKKNKPGGISQPFTDPNTANEKQSKQDGPPLPASSKRNITQKKQTTDKVDRDITIQLPQSLTDTQAINSSKNMFLSQFIQNHLQQKKGGEEKEDIPQQIFPNIPFPHYHASPPQINGERMNKEQMNEIKKQFNIYQQQFVNTSPTLYTIDQPSASPLKGLSDGSQRRFRGEVDMEPKKMSNQYSPQEIESLHEEIARKNQESMDKRGPVQISLKQLGKPKRYSSTQDNQGPEIEAGPGALLIPISAKIKPKNPYFKPGPLESAHMVKTINEGFTQQTNQTLQSPKKKGQAFAKKLIKTQNFQMNSPSWQHEEEGPFAEKPSIFRQQVLAQTELKIQPEINFMRPPKPLPIMSNKNNKSLQMDDHNLGHPQTTKNVHYEANPRKHERLSMDLLPDGMVRRGSPLAYHGRGGPFGNSQGPFNQIDTSFDSIAKTMYSYNHPFDGNDQGVAGGNQSDSQFRNKNRRLVDPNLAHQKNNFAFGDGHPNAFTNPHMVPQIIPQRQLEGQQAEAIIYEDQDSQRRNMKVSLKLRQSNQKSSRVREEMINQRHRNRSKIHHETIVEDESFSDGYLGSPQVRTTVNSKQQKAHTEAEGNHLDFPKINLKNPNLKAAMNGQILPQSEKVKSKKAIKGKGQQKAGESGLFNRSLKVSGSFDLQAAPTDEAGEAAGHPKNNSTLLHQSTNTDALPKQTLKKKNRSDVTSKKHKQIHRLQMNPVPMSIVTAGGASQIDRDPSTTYSGAGNNNQQWQHNGDRGLIGLNPNEHSGGGTSLNDYPRPQIANYQNLLRHQSDSGNQNGHI